MNKKRMTDKICSLLIKMTLIITPLYASAVDAPYTMMLNTRPLNILKTNASLSKHTIIVEKSTHKLHIFEDQDGFPKYLRSYKIATGKSLGDKVQLGDLKTPEGIYQIEDFLSQNNLAKRFSSKEKALEYGAGAFTISYPNPIDQIDGKTGGGIWLHSTDDDSRIDKGLDSRGCVVVVDSDLKDISKYIKTNNTNIIITHNLLFMNEQTWNVNKQHITETLDAWKDAWTNEDIDKYISFYHPQEFKMNNRNYNAFKSYKKSVFNISGKPTITIKNTSIFFHEKYATITFEQHYESSVMPYEVGQKTLYLKRDKQYNWKIVSEKWAKLDDRQLASLSSESNYFQN